MGEITKEEIQDRVHGLAVNVQDPKRHTSFVPGQIWWLASANKNYVGREVTFWEQIDVSLEDIVEKVGREWKALADKNIKPWCFLRFRKNGNVQYVTISKIHEGSQYGDDTTSPTTHPIVVRPQAQPLSADGELQLDKLVAPSPSYFVNFSKM